MRALIARPNRKAHLATLVNGAWLTLCDRDLPVDGTAAREHDWADEITDELLAGLCAYCRTPLLVAHLVAVEIAPDLVAEVRSLRARLASSLDTVRSYSARILSTTSGTTEAAIEARRHDERVDRRLARIGR